MKKKLLLRLCLPLLVVVTAYSCRTDQLPEQETYYNNKAKFQLTSKRISLDESKHKKLLFSELEKSKTNLQKLKLNIAGKVINYGNGVSIDTDDVIYIENGPNYHTYTFHITRENALPNDPVENLVLTPLKDGTYRELFVSYNFTPQEKEILRNGGFVDTKGKTIITELGIGTYSPLSKGGMTTCGWVESETFVTVCSENQHGLWNTDDWGACQADVKPGWHTTMVYKCEFLEDINNPTPGSPSIPYENPGGPSDGGGVPGTGTGDCDSPGVLTEPQDPSSGMGEGGCDIGVPSLPNLPNPKNTPCSKTKALLANPAVQAKMNDVYAQSKTNGEIGFMVQPDGTPGPMVLGDESSVQFGDISGYSGYYHDHPIHQEGKKGVKILSCPDIRKIFEFIVSQQGAPVSNSFGGMVSSQPCGSPADCPPDGYLYINYLIRFNGTFDQAKTIRNKNYDFKALGDDYSKFEQSLRDKPEYASQYGNFMNFKGLEKVFFYALDNMEIDKNLITLQRIDKDGKITNVTLGTDGNPKYENCP